MNDIGKQGGEGNLALKVLQFIGSMIPPLPHATAIINRLFKPIYLRKHRPFVLSDVLGITMELDPTESVDAALLFYPHLYDRKEIAFLRKNLDDGDIFIDVGAHIGFYSLIASRLVGNRGKVVAIEADPYNFARLERNISLNNLSNIIAINKGVSDKEETLMLAINTSGNRGGNSFLKTSSTVVPVDCVPLLELIQQNYIKAIKGIKIDIEGFEFKVLNKFLHDVTVQELFPYFFIVEYFKEWVSEAGGDSIQLLKEYGYIIRNKTSYNRIMIKKESL